MVQATAEYSRARTIIEQGDRAARATLAADPATLPEILFFLAEDPEAEVRRAVAGNRSNPPQSDSKLARDPDVGVRCALARKVVGDGLPAAERRKLWRMGFTILETLARDQVVRVRRILAEAFARPDDAPHPIVLGLARDPARVVAAPVLEHSPVLTDDDMVTIVAGRAPDWAQAAIAARPELSPAVSRALTVAGSVPAVARLIRNPAASIADTEMERIVARAGAVPEWQAPLVARPRLAPGFLTRLARLVAAPLLDVLRARTDLDPATAAEIERTIAARPDAPSHAMRTDAAPRISTGDGRERPAPQAPHRQEDKALTDDALALALAAGDRDVVIEALGVRAGLPRARVRRMVAVKNGKTMMALAWKAGLSARFGMELQRSLARIPPPALVYPRDGLEFPFSPTEMTGHLGLFED